VTCEKESRSNHIGLAVVVGASLLALSLFLWSRLDTRPQPVIDEYVEKILNLADALRRNPLRDYPRALYWATIGPRTPVYQWLAAPLVLLFGRSADSILILNLFALVVLGVATYRAGCLIEGPETGAIAALFAMMYPLQLQMAREARAHSLVPTVVALFVWAALRFLRERSVPAAWTLLAAVLLVFGVHATGLYLVGGPLVAALVSSTFFRRSSSEKEGQRPAGFRGIAEGLRDRVFLAGVLPAGILVAGLIVAWVGLKWQQFRALRTMLAEAYAPLYSTWYLETTLPKVLSPFFAMVLVVGLVASAGRLIRGPRRNRNAVFLLSSLFLMIGATHLYRGAKEWRLFLGVLPAIALVSANGLTTLRNEGLTGKRPNRAVRVGTTLLLVACGGAALLDYTILVWGVPGAGRITRALGLSERCSRLDALCPDPPQGGEWPIDDLLARVLADPRCEGRICTVTLVSHRQDDFSDEAFAYTLVERFPEESRVQDANFYPRRRVAIRRLGDGEGGIANWLRSDFVVYLTSDSPAFRPTDSSTSRLAGDLERAIVDFLRREGEPRGTFKRIIEERLPGGEPVILAAREAEISAFDAARIASSLDLPEGVRKEMMAAAQAEVR
jgi:hypothetical protein